MRIRTAPKVNNKYLAIDKRGRKWRGRVLKIAMMPTGCVMAQMKTQDGLKKWLAVSRYVDWYIIQH